eukprot:gene3397-6743_t
MLLNVESTQSLIPTSFSQSPVTVPIQILGCHSAISSSYFFVNTLSSGVMSCPYSNIWKQAEMSSGVLREERDRIITAGIFEKVGLESILRLSVEFYEQVYNDYNPMPSGAYFRDAFSSTTKTLAIKHQQDYLIEKFGGPPVYSQTRKYTGLIRKHAPYPVTSEAADRWLTHMSTAIHSIPQWDEESIKLAINFFRFEAQFIVIGLDLVNPSTFIGYSGNNGSQ